ncbi:hypothetical protein Tco_0641120 [Tanacetum coccineum]
MSKSISLTFSVPTRHTNKKLAQNPSTPSSQHSQSSSAFQQYPGFGTQYGQQKNAQFQNLQKQPDVFQQSQLQPRFKERQSQPTKDNRRGKRVAKRATVDLVDENEEEEEPIRQCARWTREEEILLTQRWIETSENDQIGADRSENSFWGQIVTTQTRSGE